MMDYSVLAQLSPLAATIIDKLVSGGKVSSSDKSFVLLYSMASDIKELRQEFNDLSHALRELKDTLSELRVDVARLNGKVGG